VSTTLVMSDENELPDGVLQEEDTRTGMDSSSPNANSNVNDNNEYADDSSQSLSKVHNYANINVHGAKRGLKRSLSRSLADASETNTRQSLSFGEPSDTSMSTTGTQQHLPINEHRTSSLFDGGGAAAAAAAAAAAGRRTSLPSNSSFSSRSQLFPEASEPSLAVAPTLMGYNDTNSDNNSSTNSKTPKMAGGRKSASLFGSVMKNVQELSSRPPGASASTSASSSSSSEIAAAQLPPSTPTQQNHKFSVSPGGFQLLDFVNAVDSPFHFPGSSPQADSAASTPRRDVEWHETTVGSNTNTAKTGFGLIDWSLKKSLTFECQPGLSLMSDVNAQRLGMMQFLSGLDGRAPPAMPATARGNKSDSSSAAAAAATQWQAGLLLWQHPALYPLPASMEPVGNRSTSQFAPGLPSMNAGGGEKSDSLLSKDGASKSQMDAHSKAGRNIAYDLAQASMPPPKASGLHPVMSTAAAAVGKRNGFDSSSNDTRAFMERRKCEWQEAFRSLYLSWIQEVRRLADKWDYEEDIPQERDIADTYFYACGKGHTILFRVGIQHSVDDDDDNLVTEERDRDDIKLVPEIVITSSTRQTREKLRSMGVKFVLLERWEEAEGEFQESIIDSAQSQANDRKGVDASPAVKAELAALRRAQVYGQTVGADVSITTKPRSNVRFRSPKGIPPLVVSGEDECAAFFEVYLNSLGQIGSGMPQAWHASDLPYDVPRLLCRKLGPFLHSSMQSIDLKKKRSDSLAKSDGSSSDEHVSIELRGILLPCAVRDLICAIINGMLASETEINSAESQNLIVRTTTYDGEELQAIQGAIGSHSSAWLNSKADVWGHLQEGYEDGKVVQQCRYGEVLMMAVWDSTRPSALAYKLDYKTATLLGY
jgi:hypothetical protein